MTDQIIELDTNTLQYLDEETYREYFPLFTQLKAALADQPIKFTQFQVEYHGSGDSGDHEEAILVYEEGSQGGDANDQSNNTHANYKQARDYLPVGLSSDLEEFIVNKVDYDWYNNDGGGGTAFINLADGHFGYEGYWNETVSHDIASGYQLSDKR